MKPDSIDVERRCGYQRFPAFRRDVRAGNADGMGVALIHSPNSGFTVIKSPLEEGSRGSNDEWKSLEQCAVQCLQCVWSWYGGQNKSAAAH